MQTVFGFGLRVAVIGAGAAGLTAAWVLRHYRVTLFEREEHLGGHAWTVDVQEGIDRPSPD